MRSIDLNDSFDTVQIDNARENDKLFELFKTSRSGCLQTSTTRIAT